MLGGRGHLRRKRKRLREEQQKQQLQPKRSFVGTGFGNLYGESDLYRNRRNSRLDLSPDGDEDTYWL